MSRRFAQYMPGESQLVTSSDRERRERAHENDRAGHLTNEPQRRKMQNLFQVLMMIAAFNFLSAIAFGQNQWTRQSPFPAARNLTGVAWATSTHGFASGEARTFIETFDGGVTWNSVNIGASTSDPFYNTYCRDADNCFVIGNDLDHWRTTNGGATWQQIASFPSGGSWRLIDFVSASVGFMGSNGATARTTDGGATWTLMSDFPACPVMYGMDFRDAQVGLVGGNRVSTTDGGPGIFKTTDAGVTWVRKFLGISQRRPLAERHDGHRHRWSFDLSLDGHGRNLVRDFKPDFHRHGRNEAAPERDDCRRFRWRRCLAQHGWRF